MQPRALLVPFVALILTLSGCAGKAPPPLGSTPPPTLSPDAGAIEGRVVDEELNAIAGADVGIVRGAQTVADADGAFRFQVEPGSYEVAAQKLGYEGAARRVEVVAGEVSRITITLKAFDLKVPFNHTRTFDGHIQAGGLLLDLVLDESTGLPAGCVKCDLNFTVTADMMEVLFELSFRPTIANPNGGNILEWQLWSLDGEGNLDVNYGIDTWASGGRISFNRETALPGSDGGAMPAKAGKYVLISYCDAFFVCQDQRFQIFHTYFHHEGAPENFTALPK